MPGEESAEHPKAAKGQSKQRATRRRKQRPKRVGTCFVLMPFKEPFDSYFTAIIEPAVLAAHMEPRRGDSLFRPSPIMGDIWEMIQDAKVLVAELTGQNANVFYELGLAHAIGKPVVLVTETMDDVPFDLQPLRVILYDKSDPAWGAKLKGTLTASLSQTVADTAQAVPPTFRKIVKSQAPEESAISLRLFDLERRVAAMASQPLFAEGPSVTRSVVDWTEVSRRERDFRDGVLLKQPFGSRESAVAWSVVQLNRGMPHSRLRRHLSRNLGPSEGTRVFQLALMRRRVG